MRQFTLLSSSAPCSRRNRKTSMCSTAPILVVILLVGYSSAGTKFPNVLALDNEKHEQSFINNGNNTNEQEALEFLNRYNAEYAQVLNKYVLADWAYNTNLTEENAQASIAAGLAVSAYNQQANEEAQQFDSTNFSSDTRRQIGKVGGLSLSNDEMKNLSSIISEMGSIYGQAKLCRDGADGQEECLALEPELTVLLAESTNVTERLWAWEGWHNLVGQQIKPLYEQYVELKNKLAVVNGFKDYGDQLRQKYETSTFESDVQELYEEMKPLYLELHAYVRRKLWETYGSEVVDVTGTLPQHLLGDMWGRFWVNLYRHSIPFPDRPSLDPTPQMIAQNYTITKMFQVGYEFYTSMGLQALPGTFYNLSMLDKPTDGREVICHATAWDFYDGKDFRIKMCTKVNFDDFLTIHHELGHVQYFMQYADQPTVYRDGANDGFHEAVGELMSMCVSTPKHLHAIGLIVEEPGDDRETEINYLLSMALSTVQSLPFHYLQDLWRWRAFRGEFPLEEWNNEFWKLSEEIVGVSSPVARGQGDLDPPTIFHVAQDYDMIRYFSRTVLQFQFAESLCQASGHEGPLNECDFYGSVAAGDKLASMLKMGNSKPWPDALEALTGERTMNARAIRSYFQPLEDWLKVQNWLNGDTPGWTMKKINPNH